ncbi:MAG: transcriptional regulator [Pseudopedobacter saltans]|uniref:Transcriptional regulator n=1 Tax=Pseudopedobacter saltans TaxID=151895 RepID=A0A2W5EBX5_9SPHI|nr:MAG: transcriptional regulator [Pseudopedobacter saltans]
MKSKIDKYVIDQVRQRREAKDMSQADLAYELKVSVGFIGKVESHKYTSHYNIKHLNSLAMILDCILQDFLPKSPIRSKQ